MSDVRNVGIMVHVCVFNTYLSNCKRPSNDKLNYLLKAKCYSHSADKTSFKVTLSDAQSVADRFKPKNKQGEAVLQPMRNVVL